MSDQYQSTSIFRVFKTGAIVFHDGELSEYIYYVEKGSLQAFTDNDGQRVVIGEIKPGEFVGELGVLQETSRNANVIALEETHVKELNKWAFLKFIAKDPKKSAQLIHTLIYRTRNVALISREIAEHIENQKVCFSINPIKNLVLLGDQPFRLIKNLIYKRENTSYKKSMPTNLEEGFHSIKKNRVLFYEGQDSHYACRVISGKFRSLKSLYNSYEQVGETGPGEFIGEMGLLEDTPRSLTVVAIEDSEIQAFNEIAFLEQVYADPERCFELIKTLSRRSVQLNHHLKKITKKYASILNPSLAMQAKQFVQSIGDVSFLTRRMLVRDLYTVQQALRQEIGAVQGMLDTYYRYIAKQTNKEEMELANAEFRNLLKTLGLGAMLVIPGSFITIPLAVKIAKSLQIDILPKSRMDYK